MLTNSYNWNNDGNKWGSGGEWGLATVDAEYLMRF